MWATLQRWQREFRSWRQVSSRRHDLVVYAEGRSDWPFLGPVVDYLLDSLEQPLVYLTSDAGDPILERSHPQLLADYIGSGGFRVFALNGLNCRVALMTMPDLDRFYLKRSHHPVHYVYLFHSLNSTQAVYRQGAFDAYDTILCSGRHHMDELRRREEVAGLKPRALVEHGYGRLDTLLESLDAGPAYEGPPEVLVAPSWGPCSLLEQPAGFTVLARLLEVGNRVALRLHPMTDRHQPALRVRLKREFPGLELEPDIRPVESFRRASLLVTDWSGTAFDFAFARTRPVLYLNTPQKIHNPEWQVYGLEPLEVSMRSVLGRALDLEQADQAAAVVSDLMVRQAEYRDRIAEARSRWVYNLRSSGRAGAEAVKEVLERMKRDG